MRGSIISRSGMRRRFDERDDALLSFPNIVLDKSKSWGSLSIIHRLPQDLDLSSTIFGNDSNASSRSSNRRRIPDREIIEPLMLWSSNQENVRKLSELISEVERYNAQRD